MKGQLVIIGARAMGRETFAYAREAGLTVKGFLDSKVNALDGFVGYAPILESVESYEVGADDVFVCALGDPEAKRRYVQEILKRGGRFVSVVHPTAYIGQNVKIGAGCIICPRVVVTNDVVLGDHVIVNVCASVNHDDRIGDYATICPGCRLAGRVTLGRNVFVGTGALLIPDVTLGDGVYVAAGATVTRSFEKGRLMGVPAVAK